MWATCGYTARHGNSHHLRRRFAQRRAVEHRPGVPHRRRRLLRIPHPVRSNSPHPGHAQGRRRDAQGQGPRRPRPGRRVRWRIRVQGVYHLRRLARGHRQHRRRGAGDLHRRAGFGVLDVAPCTARRRHRVCGVHACAAVEDQGRRRQLPRRARLLHDARFGLEATGRAVLGLFGANLWLCLQRHPDQLHHRGD